MPISMLKYIKIHKNTPTCFDLNTSSAGSMSVPYFYSEFKGSSHVNSMHADLCIQYNSWSGV